MRQADTLLSNDTVPLKSMKLCRITAAEDLAPMIALQGPSEQ